MSCSQKNITIQDLRKIEMVLDQDEMRKYNRYKREKKIQFAISRYLAKYVLSRLLNISPIEVRFVENKKGKLFIFKDLNQDKNNCYRYHFNLAHSSDLCVFSVSKTGSIGIDVEKVIKYDRTAIMYKVFTLEEQNHFNKQSTQYSKLKEFYRIWTRKEAYLKAIGNGISNDLRNITFPLLIDKVDLNEWRIETEVIEQDYVLSVATKNRLEGSFSSITKVNLSAII